MKYAVYSKFKNCNNWLIERSYILKKYAIEHKNAINNNGLRIAKIEVLKC